MDISTVDLYNRDSGSCMFWWWPCVLFIYIQKCSSKLYSLQGDPDNWNPLINPGSHKGGKKCTTKQNVSKLTTLGWKTFYTRNLNVTKRRLYSMGWQPLVALTTFLCRLSYDLGISQCKKGRYFLLLRRTDINIHTLSMYVCMYVMGRVPRRPLHCDRQLIYCASPHSF
jgi:hypothetical protein